MNLPKKQGQRLIPEYLLKYQEELIENHPDPSAEWGGGGGSTYTAGDGIDITNDEISVDDTIARTSDIPDVSKMVTTDTAQTITAKKTFTSDIEIQAASSINGIKVSNTLGNSELSYEGLQTYNNNESTIYSDNHISHTNKTTNSLYDRFKVDLYDKDFVQQAHYYFRPGKTGDVAITSEIPTNTSDLTNDSGFITSSALNGYATEQWVQNQGYSTFDGDYNNLTNKPTIPSKTSDLVNDSGYITAVAWTDITGKPTFATVATSGSYNDLSDKPTIPTYTSNLFLHNFRLVITTSGSYTSTIEATVLTKSSNQILTIAELISQLAALQATPYDDSVVGVIYGQWYRNDLTSAKETILGFGVVAGSTGNPRLYMTVPNGNGRSTNITFMSTSSAVKTVGWVNDLQNGSGYEVAAQCTDVVVPAII